MGEQRTCVYNDERECDIDLRERIKAIEVDLEHLEAAGESRSIEIHSINEKLDTLNNELARYRGFVGGILLVSTAVVGFLKLFGENVVSWVTGQK